MYTLRPAASNALVIRPGVNPGCVQRRSSSWHHNQTKPTYGAQFSPISTGIPGPSHRLPSGRPIAKPMDPISSVQSLDLSNQVSVAVAKQTMDTEKDQGEAMVDLIRQAAKTADGHIDLYA